jgi:hypothetical protein
LHDDSKYKGGFLFLFNFKPISIFTYFYWIWRCLHCFVDNDIDLFLFWILQELKFRFFVCRFCVVVICGHLKKIGKIINFVVSLLI